MEEFIAPKLKKLGNGCFVYNAKLKKLYIPELEEMGDTFSNTYRVREIIAPKLKKMGTGCFRIGALVFNKLYAPELESMGIYCFGDTQIITDLYVPKLKITENTPKCIQRSVKLERLKTGIKNILGLSHKKQKTNTETPVHDTSR